MGLGILEGAGSYDIGYRDGIGDGRKVGMCAIGPAGSTQTIARVLPAGTYYYFWISTTYSGGGSAYQGTLRLQYGSTNHTFTFNSSSGSLCADGNGKFSTGSFTLTEDTTVTISASSVNNLGMGWGMICVYT